MAKFYDNLRASINQPTFENVDSAVKGPKATMNDFQDLVDQNVAFSEELNKADMEIKQKVKDTAPLRSAIREASGGRVIVDRSIYDEKALGRLLDSVNAMKNHNNGALQPGYVIISDGDITNMNDGILGTAEFKTLHMSPLSKNYFQVAPSENYGTKNSPYRVRITDINDTNLNDYIAGIDNDENWTVQYINGDDVESTTHSHELAHTAYYDALNKTANPRTTLNAQEKAKREEFRRTHPSLQEMFDVAAKNTGYKDVQDAAASISGYALDDAETDSINGGLDKSKNWGAQYYRLAELFAEAYNDFLYNKENASEYSKELIRLYSNYVNDYNKTFSDKIKLDPGLLQFSYNNNRFVDNLRTSLRK